MKLQRVLRLDRTAKLLRLFRIIWDRGDVGDGKGYSNSFSVALTPTLLRFRRECDGWIATVFGVRIHRQWSWGGRFA